MINGAIEFVAVMAESFKCYIEPYLYYESTSGYEDLGYSSCITSKEVRKENIGSMWRQTVC